MAAPRRFRNFSSATCLIALAGSIASAYCADDSALKSAWALYSQKKFSEAADAFEVIVRKSAPNARIYYYAAAASKSANRIPRAKQLSQYVITHFPGSSEASAATNLFPDAAELTTSASTASAGGSYSAPLNLKGKTLEQALETEEGRKSLKEALKQAKLASSSIAATAGATAVSSSGTKSKSSGNSSQLVTAETIAKDGPGVINQFSHYPDSGFECSLAALAVLPKGQALLAQMTRPGQSRDSYVVRFSGTGQDYMITPQIMERFGVHANALWATLIQCAFRMKSDAGDGIEGGLSALTGKGCDNLVPSNTTQQALTQFISDAIRKQNPIVCQSGTSTGSPELVESMQAYTITDFDPTSGMLTLRNPHGANSRRFRLDSDTTHQKFEQLNDGIFKIHISLFSQYFSDVARSTI